MNRWRIGSLAASTVALAGCWSMPGAGPDHTAHNPFENTLTVDNVGRLAPVWTATDPEDAFLDPVVTQYGVHAFVEGCDVRTFSRSTGAGLWSYTIGLCGPGSDSRWIAHGSFAVSDDRLALGFAAAADSTPSDVYTEGTKFLDLTNGMDVGGQSGSPLVAARGAGAVFASPTVLGSSFPPVVQINGFDDPQFAKLGPLDDPSQRRTIRIAVPPAGAELESQYPTLGKNALFHAGTGVMTAQPGGDGTIGRAVRAFDVAASHPGCVATVAGNPVDVECPLWVTPVDGHVVAPPVIRPSQATIYVGTEPGTIYALDAVTGAIQWSAALGSAITAAPALDDDTLFVPTSSGRIVAFAADGCGAATCSPVWTTGTGSKITKQPAVAGGVVYVGRLNGKLSAFDADGCATSPCAARWSYETGHEVTGAPAVSGGQLYVGTRGALYAFGLP